jgi:ribosomal protein S18 acetylase RimI-like enzyme
MSFRVAVKADIPELVRLRINFLKEATHGKIKVGDGPLAQALLGYFNYHIDSDDFVNWLAVEEGKILATGGICFQEYPPNYESLPSRRAYIMNIYTLPEFRRRGLGASIFEKLIKEASKRNITLISLHATDQGQELYTKFGFQHKASEMTLSLSK